MYKYGYTSKIGVGAEITTGNSTYSASILKFISTFTVKAHAKHLSLN